MSDLQAQQSHQEYREVLMRGIRERENIEAAMKVVEGTAHSMGVTVE